MPRTLTALFLSLLIAHGFAQQPVAAPAPTLRTTTKLVLVDVTVTDQSHRSIHGLKVEDFALLENNVSQQMKNFEEHVAPTSEELSKVSGMPVLPSNVFTNFTPAPSVTARGPVNVLLIDRLNTPLRDQVRLRNQVLDYLKKVKPGQRIAIFGLTQQLSLLQGFTSDPSKLSAVIQKSRGKGSPMLDENANPNISGLASLTAGTFDTETIPSLMLIDRARRTLEAMNDLARYLVSIPGRKNVIWFSGSFPLTMLPNVTESADLTKRSSEFITSSDVEAELHETLSMFSRAQVAVYPIAATGVTISECNSLARPIAAVCTLDERREEADSTWDTEHTMNEIAYDTGGRAFMFNDLAREIGEAINDGSSYYTLSYTPTDNNWDSTFRKIEVRLRQKGYILSYRRGYYADDLLNPLSAAKKWALGREASETLGPPPNFSPMHVAMLHGGPEPADIVFTAKVQRASTALEDVPAAGSLLNDHLTGTEAKGPYRRYSVDYATYLRPGDFHEENGLHHGQLQFLVFAYDRGGQIVSVIDRYVTLDLNAALYAQTLKDGIRFREDLSVPEKGQYFFRIAIHDVQSEKVGAVEVPIAAVKDVALTTAQK